VGKILNWVLWLPAGAMLGYLWFGMLEQNNHSAEIIVEMEAFRSKGPRFTAIDGDELCRDIQDLQRQAGLKVRECDFTKTVDSTE
jgi:hypothetical protein